VLFFVLATVCGALAGGVVGFVVGFILGVARVDLEQVGLICAVLGFLVGLPISYAFYRWSVRRFILPQVSWPQAGDAGENAGTADPGAHPGGPRPLDL
jgi:hypothetical protein